MSPEKKAYKEDNNNEYENKCGGVCCHQFIPHQPTDLPEVTWRLSSEASPALTS